MPNPFYTGPNSGSFNSNKYPNVNSFDNMKDIYKMLTTSNNPVELFKNVAKNNPNMKPIVNLLDNGYSPEQIFNEVCRQRGINPQEFIKKLNS